MTSRRRIPPRFGEVWQHSADWGGSAGQKAAVRDALIPEFGSAFHRLAVKLDRAVNARGRSYLSVGFAPMNGGLGLAGAGGFILSDLLTVPSIIAAYGRHEAGHCVDQLDLITPEGRHAFMLSKGADGSGNWNREFMETWADDFRDWVADPGSRPMVSSMLGIF